MTTLNFFRDHPGFSKINDLADDTFFRDVPTDWWVVLTDVKNSTQSIAKGRYKEVNVVGASCIIAVKNACGDLVFPYIFGGDGATFVIPNDYKIKVAQALAFARKESEEKFGIQLRVALVPVSEILNAGLKLRVAKFIPSENNYISMFSGGGITYAEDLMKSREDEYSLSESETPIGNFNGLECRWNPMPARQDGILTLIIQNTSKGKSFFKSIIEEIHSIAPESQPVTLDNLEETSRPKDLDIEAKMKTSGPISKFFYLIRVKLWLSLILGIVKKKRHDQTSEVYRYFKQLTDNTDYIKLDDTLRMVLDVSDTQKQKILSLLGTYQNKNEIIFGSHWSLEALMTCFIENSNRHIHFVDGGNGGYTLAAVGLKELKKNRLKTAA